MAKNGGKNVDNNSGEPVVADAPVAESTNVNYTLTYRRDHPGDRCSYGIQGVPGLVVVDKGLFLDPTNVPQTITLNVALASPRADKKTSKDAEKEAKAAERAARLTEKANKAKEKAAEREKKAQEALAKAQAKAEEAKAKLAKRTETPEADTDTPATDA